MLVKEAAIKHVLEMASALLLWLAIILTWWRWGLLTASSVAVVILVLVRVFSASSRRVPK